MPTPVPALKTDELLARLKDLIDSGVRNEIKLHGLHQDAKRLLKQYPDNGDAHMALGIIEKLEGHESASVRHHEAALNCGWTSERALNYVVTLDHFVIMMKLSGMHRML